MASSLAGKSEAAFDAALKALPNPRRAETELLMLCARTQLADSAAERVRNLAQDSIDWDYLASAALHHKTLPLLYRHLSSVCPHQVPTETLARLNGYVLASASRGLHLGDELRRILGLLAEHDVEAIPLKGPVLASTVYGDATARQFDDLDLLVRPEQALVARDVLVGEGYRAFPQVPAALEAAFLRAEWECELSHEATRGLVCIQWRLSPRYFAFPIDPGQLFARARSVDFEGQMVLTLSPEDELLFLCIHGAKHLWSRLGWLSDVAELLRAHQELDWEWVLRQARTLGAERTVLTGLYLAGDLLDAVLPEQVWQGIERDPAVRPLAGQLVGRYLLSEAEGPDLLEVTRFQLAMRERGRDKLRDAACLALVPTVDEWRLVMLPRPLHAAYHVIRLVRLLSKFGPPLLRGRRPLLVGWRAARSPERSLF